MLSFRVAGLQATSVMASKSGNTRFIIGAIGLVVIKVLIPEKLYKNLLSIVHEPAKRKGRSIEGARA
jgi:hypothetical protein